MTLTIQLNGAQPELFAFSYSPLHETVRSLQVLTRSKHYPLHIPWMLATRQLLPPALKAEVAAFGIVFAHLIPDIFIHPSSADLAFPTFADELRMTERLSPHLYAQHIINQAILRNDTGRQEYTFAQIQDSPELQLTIRARTEEIHPASLPMVEELLRDPEQSHKRFLAFFSSYWEVCMAPAWPQLEAQLLRDIQHRGQILFEQGAHEVLTSLAPQLSAHQQDEEITMLYPAPRHTTMRVEEQLFLTPSSFVWPRLSFIHEQDQLLAIVYSIQHFHDEGLAPVPPERLLKLLRATGDMTRLQILRLLSQRARSTQELAGILNLSEPGISKHVKLLQDAGFVRAERASYYVLYQSVRDPLAEMTRGLDNIFRDSTT